MVGGDDFCEDSESGVRMPLISVVGDQGQNVMHSGICGKYAGSMREYVEVCGTTRMERPNLAINFQSGKYAVSMR